MELKICHMYPDVLNLYGDRGNVICMLKRLEWRGIEASVTKLPIGDSRSLAGFDLVFIGGGQDFEQQVLLSDLHRGKDREIKAAVEDGVTFLTICGGYQMLGSYYETFDGKRCDFIGALDLYTKGSVKRMIGNYKFQQRRGRQRRRPLQKRFRHLQPWAPAAQEPGALRFDFKDRSGAEIRLGRAAPPGRQL